MNQELLRAIIDWVFENKNEFQINSACIEKFRQYVYTEDGKYCYGGKKVAKKIDDVIKLIQD